MAEATTAHNEHEHKAELPVILIGGFFIISSFVLECLAPEQAFSAKCSAVTGSVIMALPVMVTALKNICSGKIYKSELVALAILAAFVVGKFQVAGILAFFLLLSVIIESRTASGSGVQSKKLSTEGK